MKWANFGQQRRNSGACTLSIKKQKKTKIKTKWNERRNKKFVSRRIGELESQTWKMNEMKTKVQWIGEFIKMYTYMFSVCFGLVWFGVSLCVMCVTVCLFLFHFRFSYINELLMPRHYDKTHKPTKRLYQIAQCSSFSCALPAFCPAHYATGTQPLIPWSRASWENVAVHNRSIV